MKEITHNGLLNLDATALICPNVNPINSLVVSRVLHHVRQMLVFAREVPNDEP